MDLRKTLQEKTGREDGFTLVELLVVIVVLGVLAAVVVFSVSGITDNSKSSACAANVKSVQVASEAYRAQTGGYATSLAALESGNYLRDVPGTVAGNTFSVDGYSVTYVPGDGSVTDTCP